MSLGASENVTYWTRSAALAYFGKPSFMRGAARALDLFGCMPTRRSRFSPEEADHVAIYADWVAVGNDLRQTMYTFEAEHNLNILKQLEEGADAERDAATVRG